MKHTKLIKRKAHDYGLPFGLVAAIVEVESDFNTFAVRYETDWKYFVRPFSDFHWHEKTEEQSQKFSYGLMQVIGSVARELGFEGRFLTELCDPEIGLEYGCKHLKRYYDRYKDYSKAIVAYNGGPGAVASYDGSYRNQDYLEKVLKKWK